MFEIIVACTETGGIGKDGKIPWHIPDDLKHFSETTSNGIVIMGRKTWDSLPIKPLPNRVNIVISRNPQTDAHYTCKNLDEALQLAKTVKGMKKVFVIGGENLYREALRHHDCACVHVTKIFNTVYCDTYFPIELLNQLYRRSYSGFAKFHEPYMYCMYQYVPINPHTSHEMP